MSKNYETAVTIVSFIITNKYKRYVRLMHEKARDQ